MFDSKNSLPTITTSCVDQYSEIRINNQNNVHLRYSINWNTKKNLGSSVQMRTGKKSAFSNYPECAYSLAAKQFQTTVKRRSVGKNGSTISNKGSRTREADKMGLTGSWNKLFPNVKRSSINYTKVNIRNHLVDVMKTKKQMDLELHNLRTKHRSIDRNEYA